MAATEHLGCDFARDRRCERGPRHVPDIHVDGRDRKVRRGLGNPCSFSGTRQRRDDADAVLADQIRLADLDAVVCGRRGKVLHLDDQLLEQGWQLPPPECVILPRRSARGRQQHQAC